MNDILVAMTIGALCGTLLTLNLRRAATERGLTNVAAVLIDGGITVTAATALRRRLNHGTAISTA